MNLGEALGLGGLGAGHSSLSLSLVLFLFLCVSLCPDIVRMRQVRASKDQCLSVHLSHCLCVCLFVCLFVCLIDLFVWDVWV